MSDPLVQRLEQRELVGPAHERRLAASFHTPGGLNRDQARRLPGGHALGLALELEGLERPVVDGFASRPVGALSDGHAAGASGRLQPGRDVDRISHYRVGVTNRTGHDLACVHSHTQREAHPMSGIKLLVHLLHRILHTERRAPGPLGVVLGSNGGAEQGHHVVPYVFVHRAPVALDLLPQPAQAATDKALDRFGVHALCHRRVAGEIGEHHGHLPPLLGRWLRRGRNRLRRRGRRVECRSAGHAELGLLRCHRAAGRTVALQRAPAGHAKPRLGGVCRATALTDAPSHAIQDTPSKIRVQVCPRGGIRQKPVASTLFKEMVPASPEAAWIGDSERSAGLK